MRSKVTANFAKFTDVLTVTAAALVDSFKVQV
jgi:hypothetical protein